MNQNGYLRQSMDAHENLTNLMQPGFVFYFRIIFLIAMGVAFGLAIYNFGKWCMDQFFISQSNKRQYQDRGDPWLDTFKK